MDEISNVYKRLILNQDKPIDYNDQIKSDIEISKKFQEDFCCSTLEYIAQMKEIEKTKPDLIVYGTVGEYLYSCFQPTLSIDTACTPTCSRGLKNPNNLDCTAGVYEKHDGKLLKTNSNNTENIYLFLGTGETLTANDREFLKSQGIKYVTVYNQDSDSINYVMGETIDLYQPISEPIEEPPPSQSYYYWGWGLGLLIIIIILICFGLFFNK